MGLTGCAEGEGGAGGDSRPGPAQMEGEAWSAGAAVAGQPHGCSPEASGTPGLRPHWASAMDQRPGSPCGQTTAPSAPPSRVIMLRLYTFLIYLSRVFLKLLVGKTNLLQLNICV